MKRSSLLSILTVLLCSIANLSMGADPEDHKTLAIGSPAPDFNLPGVDGKNYSLASLKDARILVIIFTCNHCPTAQAYEERIIRLDKDYRSKNVALIAVSPNDPEAIRLDELGYTDLGDSFEEMKIRAKEKHFEFPYLYDGATQKMSNAYGPVATPHVFIFDKERKLRYQGRIDNIEKPTKTPTEFDTRDAIDALLADKKVPVETTKVFGCSIKWSEKSDWIEKAKETWATEPVSVDLIDTDGIKELLKNNSQKLRLINIWATWCGPCIIEFPEFIKINRMYRGRDFEFITISADDPAKKEKVLGFLKDKQASNKNYLISSDDKYKMIEAVDPNWQGALPYAILVEPGGKIVYAKQSAIDPLKMKRMIVEDRYIGRYY